jgi:hypothetical protein
MKTQIDPLPAVAAGSGPFIVADWPEDAGGRSAEPSVETAGLFVAPLASGSLEALAIRQHEYGHLGLLRQGIVPRHTLRALKAQGFHDYWVQSALDVIVNAYMLAQGNPEIAQLQLWTGSTPSERWLSAVSFLRCEGMAVAREARPLLIAASGLTASDVTLLDRYALLLWRLGRDARPISVNQLAHLLEELQCAFGPLPGNEPVVDQPRAAGTETSADARTVAISTAPDLSHGVPPNLSAANDAERKKLLRRLVKLLSMAKRAGRARCAVRKRARRASVLGVLIHDNARQSDVKPGRLSILQPVRSRRARPNRRARRIVPGYSGALRYPHRALQPVADGRAFGARQHVAGGTALVDCSGSMSLETEDIARMLDVTPDATVALYASIPSSLDEGLLVIVASRGRLAELSGFDTLFGPGNVVDIPALEWLCHQREPRTWISDGIVTGEGDIRSAVIDARAKDLVRRGRIAVRPWIVEYIQQRRHGS